jgi:hypothetical protein
MKIISNKDGSAAYEKREYINGYRWWCLTRDGQIIRWLDGFEVDMIESVITRMENKE